MSVGSNGCRTFRTCSNQLLILGRTPSFRSFLCHGVSDPDTDLSHSSSGICLFPTDDPLCRRSGHNHPTAPEPRHKHPPSRVPRGHFEPALSHAVEGCCKSALYFPRFPPHRIPVVFPPISRCGQFPSRANTPGSTASNSSTNTATTSNNLTTTILALLEAGQTPVTLETSTPMTTIQCANT